MGEVSRAGPAALPAQRVGGGSLRLSLLLRAVPLVQAAITLAGGLPVYRRPWLAIAACCLATGWSVGLTARAWRAARVPAWMSTVDPVIALGLLVMLGATVPAPLLTTSFFWAASYAASAALLLGMSAQWAFARCVGLVALLAGYGVVVWEGAGAGALPVAAGTGAGILVYFGLGVVIGGYTRRFAAAVGRATERAGHREDRLGAARARAEEFVRLHDEAVQVLERVAAGDYRDPTQLRAYAVGCAARLRAATATDLADITARFAAFGLDVTVDCPCRLPEGETGRALLTAVTEALNNVAKHADTDCASVHVAAVRGGVEVRVVDHGTGYDPHIVAPGYGLTNSIHGRVGRVGGHAETISAPGQGTLVRIWIPESIGERGVERGEPPPAAARVERTLVLLGVTSRVAYLSYAAAVVALNATAYRHPTLAVGTLFGVVLASGALASRYWHRQVMSTPISTMDSAIGIAALVALAAAIAPAARLGSLNWALAYAVGCVGWLGLGHGRYRLALAAALGAAEAASVLGGQSVDLTRTVVAVVNSTSPVLYLAVFAAVVQMIRRTASDVDRAYEIERRQRHELAALAERERLFRDLHVPVAATLEHLASGVLAPSEASVIAHAQAAAVRRAFAEPEATPAQPRPPRGTQLRERLEVLARERARDGWRIEQFDDGTGVEPPTAVTRAVCAVLGRLTEGPASGDGRIRLRIETDTDGARIVIRAAGSPTAWAAAIAVARDALPAGGTIEPMPALTEEIRMLLRVPA